MKADGRITAAVAGAALARLNVDEFGLDDMDARILTHDHREVRRRPGRARHGRRRGRRGRGHAGGGLRAVPHPAGLPRAHAARALRHGARLPPLRPHAARRAGDASLTAESPPHRRLRLRPAAGAHRPGAAGGAGREPAADGAPGRPPASARTAIAAPAERPSPAAGAERGQFRPARDAARRHAAPSAAASWSTRWFAQLTSLIPAGRPAGPQHHPRPPRPAARHPPVGRAGRGAADPSGGGRQLDRAGQAGQRAAAGQAHRARRRRRRSRRSRCCPTATAGCAFVGATAEEAIAQLRPAAAAALHHARPDRRGRAALPDGLRPSRGQRRRADRRASTSPPTLLDALSAQGRASSSGLDLQVGPGHLQAGRGGRSRASTRCIPSATRSPRGWPR